MSTTCLIGREYEDGSIRAIWCGENGRPENVGRLLAEHYSRQDALDALLAMGSVRLLGPKIGEQHAYQGALDVAKANGWSTFYGRDGGHKPEHWQAGEWADLATLLESFAGNPFADWLYLLPADSGWQVYGPAIGGGLFEVALAELLRDETA